MSALYFDILKDRLYTSSSKSLARRSAQTVLYEILKSLTTLMAPILAFTTEEVWKHLPPEGGKAESVHLASFPEVKTEYLDETLEDDWERIWEIRAVVTKALEEARKAKKIGHSLDAQVHLYLPEKLYQFILPYEIDLPTLFIVSSVTLKPTKDGQEVRAEVFRAEGQKCERCWSYDPSVGQHLDHSTICQKCLNAIQR